MSSDQIEQEEEVWVSFRAEKKLLERIDRMAEKQERDRSKLIRHAVKEYLDEHEKEAIEDGGSKSKED